MMPRTRRDFQQKLETAHKPSLWDWYLLAFVRGLIWAGGNV